MADQSQTYRKADQDDVSIRHERKGDFRSAEELSRLSSSWYSCGLSRHGAAVPRANSPIYPFDVLEAFIGGLDRTRVVRACIAKRCSTSLFLC